MLRKPTFGAIALTTASLLLLLTVFPGQPLAPRATPFAVGLPAAEAQSPPRFLRPTDVWQQVYEILPDLPLENDYVSTVTGQVAEDNTLVSRLIRYHIYVKSRPPNYRLDWKLTLADYLDANEWISDTVYPSADTLRTNPRDGDMAVIQSLNRAQRDALVQTLVAVFEQGEAGRPTAVPEAATPSQPAPAGREPSLTPIPQPGDAQLLMP